MIYTCYEWLNASAVMLRKRQCSCGADLLTLSEYHMNKHLTGSKHKRQATVGVKVKALSVFL